MTSSVQTEESTDMFLSHDWGTDEQGRDNHDRVSVINDALKHLGYKTWFDSDRMTGDIVDKMCSGIDKTKLIIVFVTKRYADKVQSGQDNDNCKLEFKYAMRRKGTGNMIPVIMEERMKSPGVWEGPVGMALGGTLAVRMFSDFEDTKRFQNGLTEIKQEIDARLKKLEATQVQVVPASAAVPTQMAPASAKPTQVEAASTEHTQVVPASTVPTQVVPASTVPTQVVSASTVPTQLVSASTGPTQEVSASTVPTQLVPASTSGNDVIAMFDCSSIIVSTSLISK